MFPEQWAQVGNAIIDETSCSESARRELTDSSIYKYPPDFSEKGIQIEKPKKKIEV